MGLWFGGHDYPTISIDITSNEVGYDKFSLSRTINGGTGITLETNTANPSSIIDILKYYDDSITLPSGWASDTLIYTFSLYDSSANLIATEVWEYYP